MKKMMRILPALILALSLMLTGALADAVQQPEGGKKFEGNWAKACGLIEIVFEEEGYRVQVDLFNPADNSGTLWEYACYYSEERDALESFSSVKTNYSFDPDTLTRTLGESEYQGIDVQDDTTVFTLSGDGVLTWQDGREDAGRDLEFRNIGCFEGVWRNDGEEVYAECHWQGLHDEDMYLYYVFVSRGTGDNYTDYQMMGLYNSETGKMELYDTAGLPVESTEDFIAARDSGKPYDAFFTVMENGNILYEAADTSIELEYDILGPES